MGSAGIEWVQPPDDLMAALQRLGPEGVRAAEMFAAASDQLSLGGARAGNLVSYCTREALMSLLDLAGRPRRELTDAARRVVAAATRLRDGRGTHETLLEAASALDAALDGPGPHAHRLNSLITKLARRAPERAAADLLVRYVEILDQLNGALHSDIDLASAGELNRQALVAVGRLFGPMTGRLVEVDPLMAVAEPTVADVDALGGFLGDPRVIAYFFEGVRGPGWLVALAEHDLLKPPADDVWAARPYIAALARTHPGEVRAWLETRPAGRELDERQAAALLGIARLVRCGVSGVVLRIADTHLNDEPVVHHVAAYLDDMPRDEHGSPNVLELLKRALTGVIGSDRRSGDAYLAAGMLRVAISSARQADPARWLRVLTAKLAGCVRAEAPYRLRRMGAIDQLELEAGHPALDLLTVAVREVAGVAAQAGVTSDARLHELNKIPDPVRGRLVALHLIETLDADEVAAVALLEAEVSSRPPMPETLALLRALRDRAPTGFEDAMRRVLGPTPSAGELASFDEATEFPAAWRRAYGWLDAMPSSIADEWSAANARVTAAYGPASSQGHVLPPVRAEFVSLRSPLAPASLGVLTPLQAAGQIASWRRDTDDWSGPRARGLAETLKEVIAADSLRWLAEDPLALVRALRHPTYIAAYIESLTTHVARVEVPTAAILAAVTLVQSEPWPVVKLGGDDYDYDPTWSNAAAKSITLLGKLASDRGGFDGDRDEAWLLIARAASARNADPQVLLEDPQENPLDHAINRPSMQALEVACTVGYVEAGDGEPPRELLELVDEVLGLGSPDGLHARAIIGPLLAWFARHAPSWTTSRWDVLVGAAAPEGLGERTFDLYLEWGPVNRLLLEGHQDLYGGALGRIPEEARKHVLTGLVWGAAGYDAADVLAMLARAGASEVSEAGQWLGYNAVHHDEMPLDAALEFWEAALNAQLDAEAYAGFGWLATVARIPPERWLDLTLRAAVAAGGQLDQAARVATRALEHVHDERAIRVVIALLGADLKLWYLEDVGRVGLQMLAASDPATAAARAELRERLLEREFFDAHDNDEEQ